MEEDDKGYPMIRMGVSGWVFLLVTAYPGCPRPKAVKRLCVCVFVEFSRQLNSRNCFIGYENIWKHILVMSTCRDMRKTLFYEYYGGHLGFLQNTTCYTCKKKWNPICFSSRSYSEPESVAKSILTNKKSEITNGPALTLQLPAYALPSLSLLLAPYQKLSPNPQNQNRAFYL